MKNELTTIDRELLVTTCGGDFASKYWNTLKSDAKDWWGREKAAATAAHNGDVGGTVKNLGGALLDEAFARGIRSFFTAHNYGAKP